MIATRQERQEMMGRSGKLARFASSQDLWMRAHRGVLANVARETGVSPQFVRMVYRGVRTSERIFTALVEKGAPLWD